MLTSVGLKRDHNLGVPVRMLHKRGNNFFGACDFKGLGMGRCGQKMTFNNFCAMNLSIVVRYIMGRNFFTDFNKLNGVQQNAS